MKQGRPAWVAPPTPRGEKCDKVVEEEAGEAALANDAAVEDRPTVMELEVF